MVKSDELPLSVRPERLLCGELGLEVHDLPFQLLRLHLRLHTPVPFAVVRLELPDMAPSASTSARSPSATPLSSATLAASRSRRFFFFRQLRKLTAAQARLLTFYLDSVICSLCRAARSSYRALSSSSDS
jgi:hypothetical protein